MRRGSSRRGAGLALALALLDCRAPDPGGSGLAAAAPRAPSGPPTAPAALAERPQPGRLAEREDEAPPQGGALSPNGAVADRFAQRAQSVRYAFQAQKGELALFEIACLGFSRGWSATARVRVLGPRGNALLEREHAGGASFGLLVPFQAPATGRYALELSAPEEPYRFFVVRHAGLVPNASPERARVAGERGFGYLADGGDRARLAVDVAAGEALLIAVAPARDGFRKSQATRRAELLDAALAERGRDGVPDAGALLARDREGSEHASCPIFALDAGLGAPPVAELLLPAGPARAQAIDVVALGPAEGGLFEVAVVRAPALHRVAGRIGDVEDDPLGDHVVTFLREPSLSAIAEARTAADGTFALDVPAGDYSILVAPASGGRAERTRAPVLGATEINLIYGG